VSAAQQAASAFQQAAAQLGTIRSATSNDLQSTVTQINQDVAKVQEYNASLTRQTGPDAGAQAQLESTLEDLSGLAGIQVLPRIGGSITVLLGGQTPLVIGTNVNALQVGSDTANVTNGPPNALIVDSHGNDVTSHVNSGSLSGLLTTLNSVLPSLA